MNQLKLNFIAGRNSEGAALCIDGFMNMRPEASWTAFLYSMTRDGTRDGPYCQWSLNYGEFEVDMTRVQKVEQLLKVMENHWLFSGPWAWLFAIWALVSVIWNYGEVEDDMTRGCKRWNTMIASSWNDLFEEHRKYNIDNRAGRLSSISEKWHRVVSDGSSQLHILSQKYVHSRRNVWVLIPIDSRFREWCK
jgi:hypothetical protein